MDLVVNTLVQKLSLRKRCLYLGKSIRPLLHVKDVARAIEIAIRSKKGSV